MVLVEPDFTGCSMVLFLLGSLECRFRSVFLADPTGETVPCDKDGVVASGFLVSLPPPAPPPAGKVLSCVLPVTSPLAVLVCGVTVRLLRSAEGPS